MTNEWANFNYEPDPQVITWPEFDAYLDLVEPCLRLPAEEVLAISDRFADFANSTIPHPLPELNRRPIAFCRSPILSAIHGAELVIDADKLSVHDYVYGEEFTDYARSMAARIDDKGMTEQHFFYQGIEIGLALRKRTNKQ